MKRRTFIVSGLAAGAAAGGTLCWQQTRTITPTILETCLRTHIPLDADVVSVANQYLDSLAVVPDRESLAHILVERLSGVSARQLTEAIHQQLHQDFEEDQTVLLDGWILSRTEMELVTLRLLMEST